MLKVYEISIGVVAYFDPVLLRAEPRIESIQSVFQKTAIRPFVCFRAGMTGSEWAPLTTQMRPERLRIDDIWKCGGGQKWKSSPLYLCDGSNFCRGPDVAFIACSVSEMEFPSGMTRPRITVEGVKAILKEVLNQIERRKFKTLVR